jgi:hypothetical protein
MDETWEYEELDEHASGECNCHDVLGLHQVVAGMGSLGAVAGALRSFADELDGLAAEGWELEEPIPEEGTLRLVRP